MVYPHVTAATVVYHYMKVKIIEYLNGVVLPEYNYLKWQWLLIAKMLNQVENGEISMENSLPL